MPNHLTSCSKNMTTVDVYELAAVIGDQFEKIIALYGSDALNGLMPTVIKSLEHLEEMTVIIEADKNEISDLHYTIERLQADKMSKAEARLKYERELEEIEKSWKLESIHQNDIIIRLREEIKKLNSINNQNKIKESDCFTMMSEQSEMQDELNHVRNIIEKQKEELRLLEKYIEEKNSHSEQLQSKVKQLYRQNSENNRKQTQMEKLAQNNIIERSNVQTQLNEKERHISMLEEKIKYLEEKHSNIADQNSLNYLSRKNYQDYQELIKERDELKVKVMELEEELLLYKPQSNSLNNSSLNDEYDFDAPVYGPINKEPDEKMYPDKYKKESGIRKFFNFFKMSPKYPQTNNPGSFSNISLSKSLINGSSPQLRNNKAFKKNIIIHESSPDIYHMESTSNAILKSNLKIGAKNALGLEIKNTPENSFQPIGNSQDKSILQQFSKSISLPRRSLGDIKLSQLSTGWFFNRNNPY